LQKLYRPGLQIPEQSHFFADLACKFELASHLLNESRVNGTILNLTSTLDKYKEDAKPAKPQEQKPQQVTQKPESKTEQQPKANNAGGSEFKIKHAKVPYQETVKLHRVKSTLQGIIKPVDDVNPNIDYFEIGLIAIEKKNLKGAEKAFEKDLAYKADLMNKGMSTQSLLILLTETGKTFEKLGEVNRNQGNLKEAEKNFSAALLANSAVMTYMKKQFFVDIENNELSEKKLENFKKINKDTINMVKNYQDLYLDDLIQPADKRQLTNHEDKITILNEKLAELKKDNKFFNSTNNSISG